MVNDQESFYLKVDELLAERKKHNSISELGFFSKPFLIEYEGREMVVKCYRPTTDRAFAEELLAHHDKYVEALLSCGVSMPETVASVREISGKLVMTILQEPYSEEELVRQTMSRCDLETYLKLFELVFLDAIAFCRNRPDNHSIGFHPTLRNYAVRDGKPFYFDTFPPMLCNQQSLNRLILRMAPVQFSPWKLIPTTWVNRVSDEYYQADKMLLGIVGSSCRLRPEFANDVLDKARILIQEQNELPQLDKDALLRQLNQPPGLSGLWRFVRGVFGKEGAPNVS